MTEQLRNFPRLSGYEVTAVVCEGKRSRIYRARRRADADEVILKSPSPNYTDGGDPASLRHEYEIMRCLSSAHVVAARALEYHHDTPFLVLEDFGGESLSHIVRRRPLPLPELLRIGIQIADGLAGIHAAGVIHKDINPSNIVYDKRTGTAKIIDFGIAVGATAGRADEAPGTTPAGSFPYISPEQTGRMNRALDYRSDFYSLGATLYELLTQRPLFFVDEPVEWLHYHVAKRPTPPAEVDSRIPRVLSDMVMRLLSKNAEDRYQSAAGIAADLRHCLDTLTDEGTIESFPLGRKDAAEQFRIPQRLYGRETELEELRTIFERVRAGSSEIVFVSGPLGVGKTALVNEFRRTVTERGGYFVTGRFDALNQNVPYQAIASALGDLCRQLLTESPSSLAAWRERLLEALGTNAGFVTEIIPDLTLIIGAQPSPPRLPPREAGQLFLRIFAKLLGVFGSAEHPLVIVLDDGQWVDAATLKLADIMVGRNRPSYFLVIGAYRSTEVGPDHPLAKTMDFVRKRGGAIDEIELEPLKPAQLGQLIADSLGEEPDALQSLTDLVHAKTVGNPFFVVEFLSRLRAHRLLRFDFDAGKWTWDAAAIATEQMTDNVVGLLSEKLQTLPETTRDLLRLAACFGGRFDLQELLLAAESPPDVVIRGMREALEANLLAPVGEGDHMKALDRLSTGALVSVEFAFAHDRIREAIYEFDDETEHRRLHLRIGRILQQKVPVERYQERLFDLASHLNIGRDLITEVDERRRLGRLNLEVARKAKASTAYSVALEYLLVALELLPDDVWSKDYALAFRTHLEAAENAYLCGRHDLMERVSEQALSFIEDRVERSRMQEIRIASLIAQSRWSEAAELGRRTMGELGFRVPSPNRFYLLLARLLLKWRLRGKTVDDLAQLPEMRDGRISAAMRIGTQLGTVAFMHQPRLFPLLMYGGVATCAVLGNNELAAHVYAGYGMLLATELDDIPRAESFGKLAIEVADKFGTDLARGRALHMYGGLICHWWEPLRDSLDPLLEAHRLAANAGDFEYASHALSTHSCYSYYLGKHLGSFAEDMGSHQDTIAELQQSSLIPYMAAFRQMALNLAGEVEDPARLSGESYNEAEWQRELEEERNPQLVFTLYALKTELSYRFQRYDEALINAERARPHLDNVLGLHTVVVFCFYDSLACLAVARGIHGRARRDLLRQVSRNQKRMAHWAERNPHNCRHKYCLVSAEVARLEGNSLKAHDLYEEAIRHAIDEGFMHEAALAYELGAEMHHEAGRDTLAAPFLHRARDSYRRWGAYAKVEDLERRYTLLLQRNPVQSGTTTTYGDTTETGTQSNIDVNSLLKALRAIVDQRVHSRMLESVIDIAIEFAGAQQGALLLRNKDGTLRVEAEASVEGDSPRILQSIPMGESTPVSQAVVNYVARTRKSIVVHDAREPHADLPGLEREEDIRRRNVRSILALPILAGADDSRDLTGVLYLENNEASHMFTEARFGILEIVGLAAAGRLELSRRAAIDGLTQLYNREYFEYMLRQELALVGRQNRGLALILADIDHFKQFNDTWGHQMGDLVLEAVAGAVKENCRFADLAARYGGEEIAVILPETDLEDAVDVAERIRRAVETLEIEHENRTLGVTVSLGVARLDDKVQDADTLIREADRALYKAKAEGRNRVIIAKPKSLTRLMH